jgi:hypothetical protein
VQSRKPKQALPAAVGVRASAIHGNPGSRLKCLESRAAFRLPRPSSATGYAAKSQARQLFHGKQHPSSLREPAVNEFLTSLAVDRHVAASTQNQALAALLFLYESVLHSPLERLDDVIRARKPKRLPTVLAQEEVAALLAALNGEPATRSAGVPGAGSR